MKVETKFIANNRTVKGSLEYDNERIIVRFAFNRVLISEIKSMEGARWNPDHKYWTITNSQRNQFQLSFLQGINVYAPYDAPLLPYESKRDLKIHQIDMVQHGITRHYCIIAAQMGTGKTLSAIEIAEYAKLTGEAWWVAPKSALRSVELEFEKWKSKVKFKLFTYEGLKKAISNWPPGKKAPQLVICDECSRVKSPTAQRSQAAYELADGIRNDWGDQGYVIEMSGTPAPKSPADWFHLTEIARPGFLKEGNIEKFKKRLGLIVQKESIQGGVYPHLVTWKDDERKCNICGEFESSPKHNADDALFTVDGGFHAFEKSTNEVLHLYERLKGLVLVKFKKDCLDLPDKTYDIIRCKPTASILRAASIITAKSTTVIGAMVLLRELSDGFQYNEEEIGVGECNVCFGKGTKMVPIAEESDYIEVTEDNQNQYPHHDLGEIVEIPKSSIENYGEIEYEETSCPSCGGNGVRILYKREAVQVPCPKEDAVKELLDEYSDVGRTVFFAGFTASIDRIMSVNSAMGWNTIKVDGRGWSCDVPGVTKPIDMLRLYQAGPTDEIPRLAFIGQPGAAGMGLTLTASPMICYYSNDFNSESRSQSEDRIHRMGMDVNRGARIIDLIHLPTDEIVLNNLRKKKTLQEMSMGSVQDVLKSLEVTKERLL